MLPHRTPSPPLNTFLSCCSPSCCCSVPSFAFETCLAVVVVTFDWIIIIIIMTGTWVVQPLVRLGLINCRDVVKC